MAKSNITIALHSDDNSVQDTDCEVKLENQQQEHLKKHVSDSGESLGDSDDSLNDWHIAGGSSGGSAVAVATSMCVALVLHY